MRARGVPMIRRRPIGVRPRDAVETAGPVERDSVMPIQLSTDQRVVGSKVLAREVDAAVGGSLSRLAERITRVEVHLTEGGWRRARG